MKATSLLSTTIALAILFALPGSSVSCADPTHDDAVSALGDSNERNGPTHRPGQPCLVCHGGSGPASAEFSIAGTVYQVKGGTDPVSGATVALVDATGVEYDATTNEAGNFYIAKTNWQPTAPIKVSVTLGNNTATMISHIGRDGSCGSCHTDPPGPRSPGRVYLVADVTDLDAGGSK